MTAKQRIDRMIDSVAEDINRLPGILEKISAIESDRCVKCLSLTLAFLKKQVKEIEDAQAKLSPRMLRIARKHAANLSRQGAVR
jgi:hypothetical protein